jgi:hypothetical protein
VNANERTRRRAACACGQLEAVCIGEPVRISMCHCLACQRRTGSIFGVQARFPEADVTVTGSAGTWERVGDAGGRVAYRFCTTCGTTLTWTIDTMPGLVAVAVGAFADPGFPAPRVAVYEAQRHAWSAMPALDGIERYA